MVADPAGRGRHEWARARKPYDPRGSPAAQQLAEELVTIALALNLTPAEVRALSWDETVAYLRVIARRERRRARARARRR